jgi:hypothetical protein
VEEKKGLTGGTKGGVVIRLRVVDVHVEPTRAFVRFSQGTASGVDDFDLQVPKPLAIEIARMLDVRDESQEVVASLTWGG